MPALPADQSAADGMRAGERHGVPGWLYGSRLEPDPSEIAAASPSIPCFHPAFFSPGFQRLHRCYVTLPTCIDWPSRTHRDLWLDLFSDVRLAVNPEMATRSQDATMNRVTMGCWTGHKLFSARTLTLGLDGCRLHRCRTATARYHRQTSRPPSLPRCPAPLSSW